MTYIFQGMILILFNPHNNPEKKKLKIIDLDMLISIFSPVLFPASLKSPVLA